MTPAARERRQVQAPALFVAMAAWVMLIVKPGGTALAANCCPPLTVGAALSSDSLGQVLARNPLTSLALGWMLMLAAMMGPLLAAPVRHVLDRSFARRRARAVLLFLGTYTAIWMAAGALLLPLALVIRLYTPVSIVPMLLAILAVLAWQCSPLKQRCLNRGHAHTELAAFGVAGDIGVLRFAVAHGIWCVGSCWALMLLPELFSQGHVAAMAAVTLWLFAERLERPTPPRWRLPGVAKAPRLAVARVRMLLKQG